jgi:hypothetical protein
MGRKVANAKSVPISSAVFPQKLSEKAQWYFYPTGVPPAYLTLRMWDGLLNTCGSGRGVGGSTLF